MSKLYCVKCKNKTDTDNIEYVTTENGRRRARGVCNDCGSNKSSFVGSSSGSSVNAPKTPVKPRRGRATKVDGYIGDQLDRLDKSYPAIGSCVTCKKGACSSCGNGKKLGSCATCKGKGKGIQPINLDIDQYDERYSSLDVVNQILKNKMNKLK